MSFGGAVKLTGESEYRKALQNISQSLKEVSAQMKLTSTEYDKNDKSSKALAAQSTNLNNQLKLQTDKVKALENQYKSMSEQYNTNAQKHSKLVQEYNKEKTELDNIGRNLGTTSKEYQTQKDKVEELAKEVTKSSNAQEQNAKSMSNMRIQIANAQGDVNKTTKALNDLGNEAEDSGKQAEKGSDGFTVLKGVISDLTSRAIASAINGLKKLGEATLYIGKQAISSYAEYEQLVGGVETLFKDSAGIVQDYAAQAYKTAGISANQYMEQATSFSASLLQGLGGDTEKAAKIADMAITDMADNANKMGTSIEMIQNAYQGFAKQNYTMLDNLKLGYGGTKAEMARLINDSGVLKDVTEDQIKECEKLQSELGSLQNQYAAYSVEVETQASRHSKLSTEYKKAVAELDRLSSTSGTTSAAYQKQAEKVEELRLEMVSSTEALNKSKEEQKKLKTQVDNTSKSLERMSTSTEVTADTLDSVPFDKMIEAIHKVQENMDITGTTSKEAANTISGSVASMKAAWSNLLTAIANDNADLGKSVDEFIESVITAGKNIVPRIKQVVEGVKKLINSIVTEVFPKLKKEIPQLKPLIEVFEWFVKNKNLVVGAIKAMITAFAVSKIVSFSKGLTDLTRNLIATAAGTTAVTTATNLNTTAEAANTAGKVVATTATGALTAATNLLNAAWAANPIGLVLGAVTALVGAYSILKNKSNEVNEAQKAQSEEIENLVNSIHEEKQAWDDLVQSQQKQIDAGMTELNHYENLYDELTKIVDENGKVKEGYEERASFIVSRLNNALGTEITMTGNVVDKYSELRDMIQQVMDKKKAQIILESQEALYTEAINNKVEANKKLLDIEQQLQDLSDEGLSLTKDLMDKENEYQELLSGHHYIRAYQANQELEDIRDRMATVYEETDSLKAAYDEQDSKLKEYYYNISLYESNAALAHAGAYDQMSQVTWELVKDYQDADDAQKKILENQVKYTQTELDTLKEMRRQTGSDIYDQQISDGEKQLEKLRQQLEQYNSATETELNKTTLIWSDNLDDQLSEISGAKVEFRDDGAGNVTAYIDGVQSGEAKSKEQMAKIVENTIREISRRKTGAETAGSDLIDGINNGIANERKQSGVFSTISTFGTRLLSRFKASLQEQSPSKATKEMGEYLLQGLGIGIDKEENSILTQITNFGKSVISSLNSGLSGQIQMSAINDINDTISNFKFNSSRSSLADIQAKESSSIVEDFKQALSQMKIEMDDETMGKFVDKTVARTIYS